MLTSDQIQCMHDHGYCVVEALYDHSELESLQRETEACIDQFYTKQELDKHSVYPSDKSDARVSHAMMISEGKSDLPKVDHSAFPAIDRFLQDHNALLAEFSQEEVKPSSRCMLNFQNYFSGSKPVGEHFDGEYLRAAKAEDGVEFALLEGILPRYVVLLVLKNENNGRGIELVDNLSKEIIRPQLHAGDLIMFNNIDLRHRVPRLEHPRTSMGLRNFDHQAVHFAQTEDYFLSGDYRRIAEGWISEDVDCQSRMKKFMKEEWPTLKEDYDHYV